MSGEIVKHKSGFGTNHRHLILLLLGVALVFIGITCRSEKVTLYLGNKSMQEIAKQPGLYQNGVLQLTWSELESQEIVVVEDTTLVGVNRFEGKPLKDTLVVPEGIVCIGDYAFTGQDKLKEVVLPTTLISIGSNAFRECDRIVMLSLPNGLESIEGSAFEGCNSLAAVEIPDSVITIGSKAFSGCRLLYTIDLPKTAQVAENAFSDVTQVIIRNHVKTGAVAAEEEESVLDATADRQEEPSKNATSIVNSSEDSSAELPESIAIAPDGEEGITADTESEGNTESTADYDSQSVDNSVFVEPGESVDKDPYEGLEQLAAELG